jgi:hypothetical protein
MRLSFHVISLLVLASLSPAIAQSLSVGIKAGLRLNDAFSGSSGAINNESKRYTVGPMLDLQFPLGFGLEFDALYRREGYTVQNFDFNLFTSRERSNSWEFPIIAKYRLPGIARVAPYAGLGYAPQIVHGSRVNGAINYGLMGNIISVSSVKLDTDYDVTHGVVVEGGFNLPTPHVHIAPEIRYTRWNKPFLNVGGLHGFFYSSLRDQIEILVGVTWH